MTLQDCILCNRTVTLYCPDGTRQVVEGCYYTHRQVEEQTLYGVRRDRKFLLILPKDRTIAVGDRVYDGIGPEQIHWDTFIPANTPGLSEVAYVKDIWFGGELHHLEAGR